MKAWRFYGFGDLRLDEVEMPELKARHVLVQVLVVQPSVTEAQLAAGVRTLAFEKIKKRLETEAPVQLFGHEFCVRIVEVGAGVTRFKVGDRVAARAKLPCESCPLCLSGRGHLCRKGPIIGFQLPGCFCEYAVLPEIALTLVDERISDSEAACLQSLSDSVASVETADIQIGNSVAILGQGSMGLECMQIARVSGAGRIITVDVRDEACAMSKELGADYALNANSVDPVEAILELTDGNGADIVFECAGGSPTQGLAGVRSVVQAMHAVRSGGKIIGVSWFGSPFEVDVDLMRERSLRYLFPDISTLEHLQHTVNLVAAGRVRMKPTITHVLEGIERVPEAFEITANKGKYKAINPAQVRMAV
ncbi:MAG: alcohol dehydrogenase catalytic domain-containing protein [Acidobacteria bacterium]|nr:alcohol dehydrogenase catalytic domain-containing protein [Acidobacteriota bacterium]